MKKMLVCLLVLVLMLTNLSSVLAEPVSTPPASQISTDSDYAEVVWRLFDEKEMGSRGAPKIVFLKATISKNSSSSITISAETDADINCAFVGGHMIVQRWINNSWSTCQSYTFWAYGTAIGSSTRVVTVPSGYYYRLVVSHIASAADGTTAKQSTTTSILVN